MEEDADNVKPASPFKMDSAYGITALNLPTESVSNAQKTLD